MFGLIRGEFQVMGELNTAVRLIRLPFCDEVAPNRNRSAPPELSSFERVGMERYRFEVERPYPRFRRVYPGVFDVKCKNFPTLMFIF